VSSDPDTPAEQAPPNESSAPLKRAAFLDRFPEHEDLSRAVTAFENGNYAEVRQICSRLLDSEEDEEVRDCARELLRRIEPDRLIVGVLWASFALFALIALWAYGHGH